MNAIADRTQADGVRAKLENEFQNIDAVTRAKVAKVEEDVVMKARDMAGITAPLGFFDPLGFSTDAPEGKLLFYREVELKHGRICMLASLGIFIGEKFHPLFGGNIDAPAYVAFQQTPLQSFWPIVIIVLAVPEIASVNAFQPVFSGGSAWQVRTDRMA